MATQSLPPATVSPAGLAPTMVGPLTLVVPWSTRRTRLVTAIATQSPPPPVASRSGACRGAMPRSKMRPPLALTAVIPAPSRSATQTR